MAPRTRSSISSVTSTRRSNAALRSENAWCSSALANQVEMRQGRDVWWDDLVPSQSPNCDPVAVDCEHPLFTLYTSGTTGKPKGVVHTTGGYLTHAAATMKWVFDLKEEDIYWCTADIGWITGHSYVGLRTVGCGRDGGDVRRRAELSAGTIASGRLSRNTALISSTRPHRDPHLYQVGRVVGEEARLVESAPARNGRRADQSRSLDLVSRRYRRRTMPDRRYLVAD